MAMSHSPREKIMSKPIAVVAFGGNTILEAKDDGTFETQLRKAKEACRGMLAVLYAGYELLLVHGNGPQIGNLLIQFENARDIIPMPPLDMAVASSQGLLGHMLEVSMRCVLEEARLHKDVATVLTQVVVDSEDPAYSLPTKPIGPFYSREHAEEFRTRNGWHVVEDSGRGYRRTVFSPMPQKIMNLNSIRCLIQAGAIVIAGGGGGIPVNYKTGSVMGTEGVIDKDFTAALLAYNLNADLFIILTGVDRISLDYGKASQRPVGLMTASEAQRWLSEGQFPPGSMGPKIAASIEFVEKGGREVLITNQENLGNALRLEGGSRIVP
jgi:carbamate kinase